MDCAKPYSHSMYAITSWESACKSSLEKIQVMQDNVIEIMNFKFVRDIAKMALCTNS